MALLHEDGNQSERTLRDTLKQVDWNKAGLGMMITCILALSVHVYMLQGLNIPYPVDYPTAGWPVLANWFFTAVGLIIFYRLSNHEFARYSIGMRCLLLFLFTAMLREALFRLPIMNAIATTAWLYSLADSVPRLLALFVLACLIVLIAPKLVRLWQQMVGALLVATVVQLSFVPWLEKGYSRVLASIASLNHEEVYKAPYGWEIEVPAYITYMEPVIACFVMAALLWDKLSGTTVIRTGKFVLLVLFINRTFIRPFIYVFYAKFGPIMALLSMGQFFLEALALGLLTSFTWRWSQKGISVPAT